MSHIWLRSLFNTNRIALVVSYGGQSSIEGVDSVGEVVDVLVGENVGGGNVVAKAVESVAVVAERISYVVVAGFVGCCKRVDYIVFEKLYSSYFKIVIDYIHRKA